MFLPPLNTITLSQADFDPIIVDVDGVVAQTADIHAAAWKKIFDNRLMEMAARHGRL